MKNNGAELNVLLNRKNMTQLDKELMRRGCRGFQSKEEKIGWIIWKDAYDSGRCEGLRENNERCIKEVGRQAYEIIDGDERYVVNLTPDQIRLLNWLRDNYLLLDMVSFEPFEEKTPVDI